MAYVQSNNCVAYTTVSGGTPIEPLCGYQSQPRDIEWGPGEDSFVFSSHQFGDKGYAIRRQITNLGGGIVELIDWPSDQTSPTWSPEGTMVAFTSPVTPSGKSTGSQVWIKQGDGYNEKYFQLTGVTGAFAGPATNPAWSPDGTQIAVNAYHKAKGGKDPEGIALLNSTTGAVESWLLDSDGEYNTAPQWSPDGKSLIFTAETSSHTNRRLQEVQVNGKGVKTLFPAFTKSEQVGVRRSNTAFGVDAYTLLGRYTPQLRFDIQEQYFADSAAEATDNSANRIIDSNKTTVLAAHEEGYPIPSLQLLEKSEYAGAYIDEGPNTAEDAAALHAIPKYANQVYGRTHLDPVTGRWWLQYWLYYYYNSQEAVGFGVHEGDWETIALRLDSEGIPDLAVYSRHADESAACPASSLEWAVGDAGAAPVVYVANASHANYFEAGVKDRPFPLPNDEAHGDGAIIRPSLERVTDGTPGTSSVKPLWFDWTGTWGFSDASPSGPTWQGTRWEDPQQFADDSVSNCNNGSTDSFTAATTESTQSSPDIHAQISETDKVAVNYRIGDALRDAEWLAITVTSTQRLDATQSRIVRPESPRGTIYVPRPLAKGPYIATASTYDNHERSDVEIAPVQVP